MGLPHATAGKDIIAMYNIAAFVKEADQPNIVGENIGTIVTRESDGDFKFAGQIGLAINGLIGPIVF